MRRPTFCSMFDEDDHRSVASGPTSSDKESRLSKVKRIIAGTILPGRKPRKDSSVQTQSESGSEERDPARSTGDKALDPSDLAKNPGIDDRFRKCKTVPGVLDADSAPATTQRKCDESMDTAESGARRPRPGEISVRVTKDGLGKMTAKEITIEIAADTAEVLLKPRKRKERLDSGGSVKQDNKVIRSNSEERAEESCGKRKDSDVRRVSSHEDLTRVRVLQEVNKVMDGGGATGVSSEGSAGRTTTAGRDKEVMDTAKENEFTDMFHNAEEIEHERRRSCERFSRAVAPPRGRRTMPKRKVKTPKKRRDVGETDDSGDGPGGCGRNGHLNVADRERSPSPGVSSSPPALDIATLHKQMEGSEPITSRGKIVSPEEEAETPTVEALVSPRNSLVMRLTHLDPSLPPSPPRDHNIGHGNYDSQEKKLSKQINSIKRQLKRYEDGFQQEFGYRPSHADKQANKDIKKLCSDLNKYRDQLKQMKEENSAVRVSDAGAAPVLASGKQLSFLTSLEGSSGTHASASPNNTKHPRTGKTMEEVLQDVEKRLQEKRQQSGRSSEISEMSRGDLLEEKVAVQKALLHLENVFGRPVTREDRDLVRPLYQRYRSLKRLVVRGSGGKLNNSTGELATILEHETMEFTTSPSSSFDMAEGNASSAPEGLNLTATAAGGAPVTDPLKKSQVEDMQNSSSSSDSLGENLHALPLSQLLEQQKSAREEKKKLRRNLREFEDSFRNETGRRAQKQDRLAVEGIYINYKQIKAKLRLLDALIAKKSCVKRNSC